MITPESWVLRRAGQLFKQSYFFLQSIRGKCIRIGCDKGVRLGWVNIDSEIVDPRVVSIDITTASGLHELYQMSAYIIEINHVIDRLSCNQVASLLEACFLILKSSGKVIIEFTDKSNRLRAAGHDEISYADHISYSDSASYLCPFEILCSSEANTYKQAGSVAWTAKNLSHILISLGFSVIYIEKLPAHGCSISLDTRIVAYKTALY